MPTDKYDLHTIDYSVQGWDTILTSDMEQLDDVIPSRIFVTLGETVAKGEALYLKAADSKWWLAQADGVKQPCHGVALESGDADDTIRLVRIGEITVPAWAWASIGSPIYLDDTTPGALTQVKPSSHIQIIGYAFTATTMLATMHLVEPADYETIPDQVIQMRLVGKEANVALTDYDYFDVPDELNEWLLTRVASIVDVAGSSGNNTSVGILNETTSNEMLSTLITIENGETSSRTAATPPVIDALYDEVSTGDRLKIYIDTISDSKPKGWKIELVFSMP